MHPCVCVLCVFEKGHSDDGAVWVSSEMKCLVGNCAKFQLFPPGHVLSSALYDDADAAAVVIPTRYFKPDW